MIPIPTGGTAHRAARTASTTRNTSTARSFGAALSAAALLFSAPLLAGCAGDADSGSEASAAPSSNHPVELQDGWAKANEDMTGVFGTLENHGDDDLVLESASSPAAGSVELHETTTSAGSATMRAIEGGFEIPAGGALELEPGGDHIMFMEMPEPILAGDEVALTLRFDNGTSLELSVLVKDTAGAQEDYGNIEGGHDSADYENGPNGHSGHGEGPTGAGEEGAEDQHAGH